jgi:lysozyme
MASLAGPTRPTTQSTTEYGGCTLMTQLRMIDVSANNHSTGGPISWRAVYGAGYRAVMIKATEGLAYVNPWLADDARGARAAGLWVGYYHFAHPADAGAVDQANYALRAIDGLPRNLGLALDLEVAEGATWPTLATFARAFHAQARTVVEHSPLYVDDDFLANLPGAPFGERLWVAQTARPRREVWAWQETTPANVPGVPAPTDIGWLHPDAA